MKTIISAMLLIGIPLGLGWGASLLDDRCFIFGAIIGLGVALDVIAEMGGL